MGVAESGTSPGTGRYFRAGHDAQARGVQESAFASSAGVKLTLTYLAVGLLLAEAAFGVGLLAGGASLLRPSTPSPAPGVVVPNGPAVQFSLEAFVTGYVGVGGTIAGIRNPTLTVGWGDHVTIVLTDGEATEHNIFIQGYNVQSHWVQGVGSSTNLTFQATSQGSFSYYCTFPGHRENGMQGLFVVGAPTNPIGPEANLTTPFISHSPTDIPAPITRNNSTTVDLYMHAVEETAEIEPGVSYAYWTYNGTVPGPFVRVRVNDTVRVHFYNDPTSSVTHSVDFHAVSGPGGGAAVDQAAPGEWGNFTFLARVPGLYVYHCGTPNIPTHIANGMFGMILVQPANPLPPVDEEFYVVESELYLDWPIHTLGNQLFNGTALLAGHPTYVVFNGRYYAFTGAHALRAHVNDTVRFYFGDIGPSDFSAFHVIGTILDTAWLNGDLVDPPSHDLQTVPVAPGDALVADIRMVYPGNFTVVDHSIVNAVDKGAVAILSVTGWANSSIFQKGAAVAGGAVHGVAVPFGIGPNAAAVAVRSARCG